MSNDEIDESLTREAMRDIRHTDTPRHVIAWLAGYIGSSSDEGLSGAACGVIHEALKDWLVSSANGDPK